MKRAILFAAAAALLASSGVSAQPAKPAPKAPRILLASDSTVANYGAGQYPQMGWGMVLKCSLDPKVEVINLARGGRSTKSFLAEGLWDGLLKQLTPGDTVLIQFGHNDASKNRPERYADSETEYQTNLTRYVADVRKAGGVPVLVTPIALTVWEGGKPRNTHGPYAAAVRKVAAATKTPLIDLTADSMAALQARGEVASKNFFMIYGPGEVARLPQGSNDTTHPNEQGARLGAALVATRLKALKLPISRYVTPASTTTQPILGAPDCMPR